MATSNSLVKQKPKFSVAIQQDAYKRLINNTLGDAGRAQRFVASISSAVAVNKALQECDAGSILTAALVGESLKLSPSPQLGQYYLVPYKKKDKEGNVVEVNAQFQIGYKGYIQLALRSGQYKRLDAKAVKEGELIHFDPVTERLELNIIPDEVKREKAKTIGYYATFEYLNGFQKTLYWSYEKMRSHADRYSQAYSSQAHDKLLAGKIPEKDMWKYSSFWYKDFDAMALKTMLRQLISKWGITSIEFQTALENDMTMIHPDGTHEYVDMTGMDESEAEPTGQEENTAIETSGAVENKAEAAEQISNDDPFAD